MLDFILINKKGLLGNISFGGSLGCSDNKMMKIRVPRRQNKAESKIITLAFRKANFDLFRHLLERISWETVLKRKDQET